MSLHESIALRLPDLPRWVEARACLLWGCCELHGFEDKPAPSLVLRDPADDALFIIGAPSLEAIREAAQSCTDGGTLIAPLEQTARVAEALPHWTHSRAILHLLPDEWRLPTALNGEVRFLEPAELDECGLPEDLRRELKLAAEHSLIAATFVDGRPVSFCYAGAVTESLWDISIDTLPEHRRRGYAALCVAHMIRHMNTEGLRPVWGAIEANSPSWRLARKLGFAPVDEIAIFDAPARVALRG